MKNAVRMDLTKMAARLREKGEYLALVKAIDAAAAVGSIREDLRSAHASLALIEKVQSDETRAPVVAMDDNTTLCGALFTNAVISYARATFTEGARPRLLGDSGLTPEERATENEVKILRNKALGHFGRAEGFSDGPIVKEAVILSFNAKQQRQYGVYTTRAQHKTKFAAKLSALIETRLRQVDERYNSLFNKVDEQLLIIAKTDPEFGPSMRDLHFDVYEFCESPEAADHILVQLEAGKMEDMDFRVSIQTTEQG